MMMSCFTETTFFCDENMDNCDVCININEASQKDLVKLPGIGERLASRIIAYRENNGPFHNIRQLRKISGFKCRRVYALKPFVCF